MEAKKNGLEVIEGKAGKELPFSVPDGYFDSLPRRIQERCTQPQHQQPKQSWIFALRSQLALAAGFALLVVAAYFGYYTTTRSIPRDSYTLQKSDYLNIVSRSISEFDDIDLYKAIENKRKTDSIDSAARTLQQRYFIKKGNATTISGEKYEEKP